ncbi:uncharacterized protein B4U80_11422 [Leptotrombidium deliense]|uniref:Uncharacterized protein n=1 Tax=Leptotrombidium deliense TaxID=299467 RepID=A0A443RWW2_9ACAR|nr:uncharacterized protein B4U80_11422 [Leptotrombidium deliense]
MKDEKCFIWSMLAARNPVEIHPERVSHYKNNENSLMVSNITLLIDIQKDIPKFEKVNEISVNILSFENKTITPLYTSKKRYDREVDLFYIKKEESHFCWIKNLSRSITPSNEKPYTKKYQIHEPSSHCIYASSYDNIPDPLVQYRGQDVQQHFYQDITKIAKGIFKQLKVNRTMIITETQEHEFRKSKRC